MSKKVLILSGSPRKGGNSDILCDEFLRGTQDAGHKAEKIRVAEKKVAPCSGCYYCSTHGGACVHKDDMAGILQKMIDADVIVLVSPVQPDAGKTYQVAICGVSDQLAAETTVTDSGVVGMDAAKAFFGAYTTISRADTAWS